MLRGPQGTLYGSSSMGGLLKFVTAPPSTESLSGHLQASILSVQNGNDPGYNVRGSINVPLSDTLALRASASHRRDPGYIDDVLTGEQGLNHTDVDGGRLSALWKVADNFSLSLSGLYQRSDGNGSDNVETGLGDLKDNYIKGTGGYQANSGL